MACLAGNTWMDMSTGYWRMPSYSILVTWDVAISGIAAPGRMASAAPSGFGALVATCGTATLGRTSATRLWLSGRVRAAADDKSATG